jgi:hypothetical protein
MKLTLLRSMQYALCSMQISICNELIYKTLIELIIKNKFNLKFTIDIFIHSTYNTQHRVYIRRWLI